MTKTEYEGFSASTPAIADKIYDRFDPSGTNCLTVNSVSSEFSKMDTDGMFLLLQSYETEQVNTSHSTIRVSQFKEPYLNGPYQIDNRIGMDHIINSGYRSYHEWL